MKTRIHIAMLFAILLTVFVIVFYPLHFGINAAIFQFALVIVAYVQKEEHFHEPKNLFHLVMVLIAGISAMLYGSVLAFFAFLASGLMLGFVLDHKRSTVLAASILGPMLMLITPFRLLYKFMVSIQSGSNGKKRFNPLVIILPFVVIMIFISLYTSISKGFNELINRFLANITFENIVPVLLLGLLWIFTILFVIKPKKLKKVESLVGYTSSSRTRGSIRNISESTEYAMGMFTIITLISLIAIVMISDVYIEPTEAAQVATSSSSYNLSSSGSMSIGRFSEDLHDATTPLVFSVALSALLIQWFLRIKRTGSSKYRNLQMVSVIWTLFNMILIFYTFGKDLTYVLNLGFSYLRIGMFIFLLLAFAGCVFTIIRIIRMYNLWYLLKNMALASYVVLVFSSLVPWDGIITRLNIQIAQIHHRPVDVHYLLSLSNPDLSALQTVITETGQEAEYGDRFNAEVSRNKHKTELNFPYILGSNVQNWKYSSPELIIKMK